ncbi:MAG: hypothetical protein ACFFE1_15665 [Candidatus Thorarchaeota archaeon]
MSDENKMIRWELDALKTEYNQHWNHFRHAIDKSYQAFNIHMVMMALLFSAVSLANDQESSSISVPLFLVIGGVAFASSLGTISTLVTQRTGYVWHQKVIDVLRERISKKTTDILEPEVDLFYDRKIFSPGTAWFGRVNFVILTGSAVVVLCAYLILPSLSLFDIGIPLDTFSSLIIALFIFGLSLEKMYHSVISHSLDRAWGLHCQLQKYENPPNEIRDIKYIKIYSQYLLAFEILTLVCAIPVLLITNLIVGVIAVNIIILALTILCWLKSKREITC